MVKKSICILQILLTNTRRLWFTQILWIFLSLSPIYYWSFNLRNAKEHTDLQIFKRYFRSRRVAYIRPRRFDILLKPVWLALVHRVLMKFIACAAIFTYSHGHVYLKDIWVMCLIIKPAIVLYASIETCRKKPFMFIYVFLQCLKTEKISTPPRHRSPANVPRRNRSWRGRWSWWPQAESPQMHFGIPMSVFCGLTKRELVGEVWKYHLATGSFFKFWNTLYVSRIFA